MDQIDHGPDGPDVETLLEHYQLAYENIAGVEIPRAMTPAEKSLHGDALKAMRGVIENLQHRVDNDHVAASRSGSE